MTQYTNTLVTRSSSKVFSMATLE